jgi:hypothetical protein
MDTTGLQGHVLPVLACQLAVIFATRLLVSLVATIEVIISIQIVVQHVVLLCLAVKYALHQIYVSNVR